MKSNTRGITLIEVIMSVALIGILFGGVFLALLSILDVISNSSLRTAAMRVINREIEIIRDMPYDSVGTVGGVPSGVLVQQKTVTSTSGTFVVDTIVRNVDDPFDSTLGGTPNDTAPADYKLVEIRVSCPTCKHFVPAYFTTTVAPKNLESASQDGSLFVNVFDASGMPVSGASVHVSNASVTPAIDLTDVTNQSGVLQLVGVPTSTQRYQVSVSKSGYSSDQSYLLGAAGNPNPVTPHATVVAQGLTSISFAIDKVSTLNVLTSNAMCSPVASQGFSLVGGKKIGTSPDVLKFSTSSATNASGSKLFSNMEWDTYALTLASTTYNVLGSIPISPFALAANTSSTLRLVLTPAQADALLVTVEDEVTGDAIPSSTVTISKSGFSSTMTTARSSATYTDWSGGQYSSQSGTDISAGAIAMLANASGTYDVVSPAWLVSQTIDFGSSTVTHYGMSWNPTSQPTQTGANSLKFQLASNNDNATWNFTGPDGTAGTYYTSSSEVIHSSYMNHRYLRYKTYLSTADENYTPQLTDITFMYFGVCVPVGQVLFNNLSAGTYTINVSAPGYQNASSTSVTVGSTPQEVVIPMSL